MPAKPWFEKLKTALVALTTLTLTGCLFSAPPLPQPQTGKALLVLGFTTDLVETYEGGQLYSGFFATRLNGQEINPPLSKGHYRVLEPGPQQLQGQCFWQLRGTGSFQDDIVEDGTLAWNAEAGQVYTVASSIDEYKFKCTLSVMTREWQ